MKKLLPLLIALFSISTAFAQGPACLTDANFWDMLSGLLNVLLSLLAWFWIPLAAIAGKLMTNSFVYGEAFHLDHTLRMLRNISRTFANFAAVGILLWAIVKGLPDGNVDPTAIGKKIARIAIGILLANLSRFLVGAVIDISTVMTTQVGALPSRYLSQDNASKSTLLSSTLKNSNQSKLTLNLNANLCEPDKIITAENKNEKGTDPNNQSPNNQTSNNPNLQAPESELLDFIMPKHDSIAGPLIYIGSSVLKLQDYIVTINDSSSAVDHVMVIIIRLLFTVLFVLVLVILIVINLFRIVYLWFFVAFTPLIFILYFGHDEEDKMIKDLIPDFSLVNIIKLIFAPVVATGLMSVTMIMIVLMQQVFQSNNNYLSFNDGLTITNTQNGGTIAADGIFSTEINGEIIPNSIKNGVANTFSDLIMLGITLGLLRGITKALESYMEGGIGGETIQNISNLGKTLLGSAPIIPIGGGQRVGASSAWRQLGNMKDQIQSSFSGLEEDKITDIENQMKQGARKLFPTSSHLMNTRPTSGDRRPFENLVRDLSQRNARADDYNTIIKNYNEKIKKHYLGYKSAPANFEGINTSLSSFLQNANKNDTQILRELGLNSITPRGENDTLSSFLEKNYKENNKGFYKKLYEDIGGDFEAFEKYKSEDQKKKIRSERMYRSGQKEDTETEDTE